MNLFKKVLEVTKIDIDDKKSKLRRGQVIGFRGVREGLGTTILATHCAYRLASAGISVCYLDLDFSYPNTLFSTVKTQSILKKWNNSRENINVILNRTNLSTNLSYVGAQSVNSIIEFMPLRIDLEYVSQKEELLNILISELRLKFDVIIVDIISDLRNIEASKTIPLCDEVLTLSTYDDGCINKLQKDKALTSGLIEPKLMSTLVHVNDHYSVKPAYEKINPEFNCIAEISKSSVMAVSLFNGKIENAADELGIEEYNQLTYYTGVMNIIKYLNGGEDV